MIGPNSSAREGGLPPVKAADEVSTSDVRHGYERSAPFYDLFDTKDNIDFFCRFAAGAGEALDVGAGTGRIAVPLARRGIKVWCIEPSPAMRREFQAKLRREPELRSRISLLGADAQSFSLNRFFPAVFISGCFDHFLGDTERLSALSNIARHLRRGGRLVFDVFLGLMKDSALSPAGISRIGARDVRRFVGGRMLPNGTKETRLVFEVWERQEMVERFEESSLVGIASREDVHYLLQKTGFAIRHEWGGYDFTPFSEGDEVLVVEAVKVTERVAESPMVVPSR